MLSLAREKASDGTLKNNVTKIIYAGDVTDGGSTGQHWTRFKEDFIKPFQSNTFVDDNIIPVLVVAGNHDRQGNCFYDRTYTITRINEWNNVYIAENGETNEDYCKVYDAESNSDIYLLSECPTRTNYKPVNWFITQFDATKNCMLVSHYSPIYNFDWWSDTNVQGSSTEHGEEVLAIFASELLPYKDNIKLYHGDHTHLTYLKRWYLVDGSYESYIWIVSAAGRNRFGLVHLDSSGNIVSVDLYCSRLWDEILRFYPQFEEATDNEDHKARFIVRYIYQFYQMPTETQVSDYFSAHTTETLWEIYVDIKTTNPL